MLTLNEYEVRALAKSPEALGILLDYYDRQITEAEAMDFDCSWQHQRVADIKAEQAALDEQQRAWEE